MVNIIHQKSENTSNVNCRIYNLRVHHSKLLDDFLREHAAFIKVFHLPSYSPDRLKGDCSISALCNEHGITQGMYYKWRDQLLTDGAKLFDRGGVDHARERLERENRRLKETIGELTIELKKNDW